MYEIIENNDEFVKVLDDNKLEYEIYKDLEIEQDRDNYFVYV